MTFVHVRMFRQCYDEVWLCLSVMPRCYHCCAVQWVIVLIAIKRLVIGKNRIVTFCLNKEIKSFFLFKQKVEYNEASSTHGVMNVQISAWTIERNIRHYHDGQNIRGDLCVLCMCERERVAAREREKGCVRETKIDRVSERKRVRVSEKESVCVCVHVCVYVCVRARMHM